MGTTVAALLQRNGDSGGTRIDLHIDGLTTKVKRSVVFADSNNVAVEGMIAQTSGTRGVVVGRSRGIGDS